MKQLYLVREKLEVRQSDRLLRIGAPGEPTIEEPISLLESIVVFGGAQITTQALRLCLENGVVVHYATLGGRLLGSLQPPGSGMLGRRMNQYHQYNDETSRLRLARSFLIGKINQQRLMLTHNRRKLDQLKMTIAVLDEQVKSAQAAKNIEILLGVEGYASRCYFDCFHQIFTMMPWNGRSRRPPRDPLNALLSLSYTLALSRIVTQCQVFAYDPNLGFLHAPLSGRPSLACDFLELLRPSIDHFVSLLVNRREIVDDDFKQEEGGFLLKSDAFRKYIRKAEQLTPVYEQIPEALRIFHHALAQGKEPNFERAVRFCGV